MHDVQRSEKKRQQNQGSAERFRASVTFERDRGDSTPWRGEIVDSAADDAARRAVFRALAETKPRAFDSVVIVLDRIPAREEAA